MHTVTNWTRAKNSMLEKQPIRVDRLNRPLPPGITLANYQLRRETLHLYYEQNIFECWRPFVWQHDWSLCTLVYWLTALGPLQISWLKHVVFLYKNESELEFDFEGALDENGFRFEDGVVSYRQELTEYEMRCEELGLPKHFGKKKCRRWVYSAG